MSEKQNRLTVDDIKEAAKMIIESMPKNPCEYGHVISPASFPKGYGICANCFQPVGDWSKAVRDE